MAMAMTEQAVRAPASRIVPLHTVPNVLVAQLAELVARWHISLDTLLAGTGIGNVELEDPLGRVDVDMMSMLLERARQLTGEPGLGYYLGLQKRVSIYGYLGFAAGSAPSLRDALGIALRF